MSISGPSSVQLNACARFTATVSGTGNFDPSVGWDVDGTRGGTTTSGLIDANGNYCAPAQPPAGFSVAIEAFALADPTKSDIVQVQILGGNPLITVISPQPATAGDQVTISGQNIVGPLVAAFTDAAGEKLLTAQGVITGSTSMTVTVPQGAVTGAFDVETPPGSVVQVQSNSIQFQRLARLRIRAPYKDLSSGESLTLQYALLGDATVRTVTFTADQGTFSSSTYLAPAVSNDTFAHITGCISGTQSCDTLLLAIHPFRISPDPPLVGLGQSLQLSALMGGSVTSANWSLLAGGGTLTTAGLYDAGSTTQDGGPALVSATSLGTTIQTSVGVTGAVPGLVNRIFDYTDQHDPNATGTYVDGMTVNGNRLYVAARNHVGFYNDDYLWIDVYDISDPAHPVWITATEAYSNGPLYSLGQYLYAYSNLDETIPSGSSSITLYTLQGGVPVLRSRLQVPGWWSLEQTQGVITLIPLSGTAKQEILVYNLNGGNIAVDDFVITLPSDANYFIPDTAIQVGTRLFVSQLENDGSTREILTYDTSVSPPNFLGAVSGGSLQFYTSGNLLFAALGGMNIYDISSTLPQFQGYLDGIGAVQLNGTQLVADTAQQGCRSVDISDATNPQIVSVYFDGVIAGCDFATKVGSYIYAGEYVGGVAVYDATKNGGPISKARLYGGGAAFSYVFDQLLDAPYLYAATSTDFGAYLNVYDTSTNPPTRIGQYTDPSQQASALQSSGKYVYLGMSTNTAVLDATQPGSPVLVSSVPLATVSMARTGNTLFAGTAANHLAILNISSPASPVILSSLSLPDLPLKIRVSGHLLLVADNAAGLLIYDITTPTSPVLQSRYSNLTLAADVAVSGNMAFVAADVDGLAILDITTPSNPTLLSKTALSRVNPFFSDNPENQALSVAVNGGLVYVGTLNDNGLVFGLDYSNPAVPRIVSTYADGDFILTFVDTLLFSGTDLFVGGSLGYAYPILQLDISQPRDAINQYAPPTALQMIPPPGLAQRNARHAGNQKGFPFVSDGNPAFQRRSMARPRPRTRLKAKSGN